MNPLIESVVAILLIVLSAYLGVGAVFAAAFVAVGIGRVDPAARGAPWRVRLLLAPGSAALWPALAARWARAGRGGR